MTGYESKRAAAQDRMLDDDDALTIAYQSGYYDGKKAAQPAQEPVAWADLQKKAQQIVESKFLWKKFIDGTPLSNDIACWMADFAQQYTTPPQQEPVAWLCSPDENGLFDPPTPDKACKDCFPVYTTPPQRPWVGLTYEEIGEIHSAAEGQSVGVATGLTERKLKEKNNAA